MAKVKLKLNYGQAVVEQNVLSCSVCGKPLIATAKKKSECCKRNYCAFWANFKGEADLRKGIHETTNQLLPLLAPEKKVVKTSKKRKMKKPPVEKPVKGKKK